MIRFALSGLLVLTALVAQAQSPAVMSDTPASSSSLRTYALRLRPGDDLRKELLRFTEQHQMRAAMVLTCVGSLTTTNLRLANQEGPTEYKGHFEIVSLVGTLSINGSHLHLSVSDSTGRTIGGHLLDGNRVYTTAELVIGEMPELDFRRETDATFGYKELTVYPTAPRPGKASPSRTKRK